MVDQEFQLHWVLDDIDPPKEDEGTEIEEPDPVRKKIEWLDRVMCVS